MTRAGRTCSSMSAGERGEQRSIHNLRIGEVDIAYTLGPALQWFGVQFDWTPDWV
jgi:hypothetical protein